MTINELCKRSHNLAVEKGFWEKDRGLPEQLALMHSELSEVLEDYRNNKELTEIYFQGEKPCGIPIEFADLLIRVFDTCGKYNIDLEYAIELKHLYNLTRPYKHGKKI